MIGLPDTLTIRLIENAINHYREMDATDEPVCSDLPRPAACRCVRQHDLHKMAVVHPDALTVEQRVLLAYLPARVKLMH
ncbi:hypothetical protein ACHMW6_00090 (plasmid) [Pseudoduganella sp. UC29_106]|uniref:hypothetical protein n=1 Tax=Pseudoduganella sp. UC29_106 TaxID=3374553 RepID=UPI003757C015